MRDAEVRFGRDLYRGTANFYDEFRRPYPTEVIDALRTRVPLGPESRVLDLACGTGQLAFGLASAVHDVVAVDQEGEFIELGRAKARRLSVENIHWMQGSAEDVELVGPFDAVTIGNAFHRLHRDEVINRLVPALSPSGCVALFWSWTPWSGERPWQRALARVVDRWVDRLGARNRVPEGWAREIEQVPHRQILIDAGLDDEGRFEFPMAETWTIASLIGIIYSSSHLNREVLGPRAAAFEQDVRTELLPHAESGQFRQDQTYAVELARRAP